MREEAVNEALLLRYIKGDINYNEKISVEEWLRDSDENKKIIEEIAFIYQIHKTALRISKRDVLDSYDRLTKRLSRKKTLKIVKYSAPVAATILLCVLFYALRKPVTFTSLAEQKVIIHTNPGMRTTLDLPDGTLVTLNSSSTITYTTPVQ